MEFRISDTFTGSLAKLTGQEQKLVKTTVFDLQTNPLNPGLRLHKLDNARDPNFCLLVSAWISASLFTKPIQACCSVYVDHHDKAYEWAQRRKIEIHPKQLLLQLV